VTTPHYGSLIYADFEILQAPAKGLALNSIFDINLTATWVQDPGLGWIIPNSPVASGKWNGFYEYTWALPPNPHFAVEHDGFYGVPPSASGLPDDWPLVYGPYPPSAVNSSFDALVYLEDLNAAWGVTNVTFTLNYNETIIEVLGGAANVTIAPLWGNESITPGTGNMTVMVKDPSSTPNGKVLLATLRFTILKQEYVPPNPPGHYDETPLTFCYEEVWDHVYEISTDPAEEGGVRMLGIVTLPMAWFEVDPPLVEYGPAPSIGEEFDVDLKVVNLHAAWKVVAIQLRLTFDPTLLQLVDATEGPFMQDPRWNLYGTFFTSFEEPETYMFPHHVALISFLMPNMSSATYDQTQYPSAAGPNITALDPPEDPVVATVRFRVIAQDNTCMDLNLTCDLELLPFWLPENCHMFDNTGTYVPTDHSMLINGTYIVYGMYGEGRQIDLYGGAWNAGYGAYPFPAPYGGQGPNNPMDLVIPQSEVKLFVDVMYNWWPVQSKDVGFEIEGPYEHVGEGELVPKDSWQIWAKLTARTDENGTATIVFRMPWPCDDPENITGVWLVTASVNVADVVITDTMPFYYEHLVNWVSISTDKWAYAHDETVTVTICYQTHSMQYYPVLFAAVLQDELGVVVWWDKYETEVGGAEWCTWEEDCLTIELYIPKWAFVGYAYIHVSAFDKDPTDGGFAWTPAADPVEICILPE
jgi:hypothetical protein